MVELNWTEPALSDLDAIADYIALDDPAAAKSLVTRVFEHVEQLIHHPESGSLVRELSALRDYRQIVEPPCGVIYRLSKKEEIFIVHVLRGERLLKRKKLSRKK